MKTITVRIETHYGRKTVYPVCPKALLFAKLAGTKTLTTKSLSLLIALDYSIKVQPQELPKEAV